MCEQCVHELVSAGKFVRPWQATRCPCILVKFLHPSDIMPVYETEATSSRLSTPRIVQDEGASDQCADYSRNSGSESIDLDEDSASQEHDDSPSRPPGNFDDTY